MVKFTKMLNVQLLGNMVGKLDDNKVVVLINPAHIVQVEPFKLVERKNDKNITHEAVKVYLYGLSPEILCHSFDEFCGMIPYIHIS